jgi:hypothetical protein
MKHITIILTFLSLTTLINAQIVTQENFRCQTKSFADFADGDETKQFKELWDLINNDLVVISDLMDFFKLSDFYVNDYRLPDRYNPNNWQQNISIKRTIIGDYDYIFKRIFSSRAQNYYEFEFLLKADTIFAVSIDNNCKHFTRYDKTIYRDLIDDYSKVFKISKSKYKRNFSFFSSYSCGTSYGIPLGQHNWILNKMIDLVKSKNKKELTKWINSIEPELKIMGIQGLLFMDNYQKVALTPTEKELIEKAKSYLTVLKLKDCNYDYKDNLLKDDYLDNLYNELIKN